MTPRCVRGRPTLAAGLLPLLLLLLLLPLLLHPEVASASKPRLRLEHVDTGRCADSGELDAYVAEVELEGLLRMRPASAYRLLVDGALQPDLPLRQCSFSDTRRPLQVAVVVETAASFAADLPQISAGLARLVHRLPKRGRFTVVTYAGEVERLVSQGSRPQAERAVRRLTAAAETDGLLALVEAVKMAIRAVVRGPADARRLVVVVSDGLNESPRRDLFRALGSQAARAGVPIFPVAYSPIDERGPLLNLGEVAKRSAGTLRWARRPAELRTELDNLAQEVSRQQVLTFRVADHCAGAHRVQVGSGAVVSNILHVPPAVVSGTHRRVLWAMAGGAGAVALLAGLGVWLLLRRGRRRRGRPGRP